MTASATSLYQAGIILASRRAFLNWWIGYGGDNYLEYLRKLAIEENSLPLVLSVMSEFNEVSGKDNGSYDLMLTPASGGASPGSGVATPAQHVENDVI